MRFEFVDGVGKTQGKAQCVGAEWGSSVNDVEEEDDGRGDGWQWKGHGRFFVESFRRPVEVYYHTT